MTALNQKDILASFKVLLRDTDVDLWPITNRQKRGKVDKTGKSRQNRGESRQNRGEVDKTGGNVDKTGEKMVGMHHEKKSNIFVQIINEKEIGNGANIMRINKRINKYICQTENRPQKPKRSAECSECLKLFTRKELAEHYRTEHPNAKVAVKTKKANLKKIPCSGKDLLILDCSLQKSVSWIDLYWIPLYALTNNCTDCRISG